jgi:hypothetical protein
MSHHDSRVYPDLPAAKAAMDGFSAELEEVAARYGLHGLVCCISVSTGMFLDIFMQAITAKLGPQVSAAAPGDTASAKPGDLLQMPLPKGAKWQN